MTAALSLTTTQNWADKSYAERVAWMNYHGDSMARERGQFVAALETYARAIRAHSANDDLNFTADRFMESVLDRADASLAPEVREYLGA